MIGKDKYDAVVEVNKAGTDQGILNGKMVGEGIAARIKLLFDDDDKREVAEEVKSTVTKQGGLVMGMVEELDRTVLVKRRARNGKKKEEGVRMQRIDDLFRSRNDPQISRKRKLKHTLWVSLGKVRKFQPSSK